MRSGAGIVAACAQQSGQPSPSVISHHPRRTSKGVQWHLIALGTSLGYSRAFPGLWCLGTASSCSATFALGGGAEEGSDHVFHVVWHTWIPLSCVTVSAKPPHA